MGAKRSKHIHTSEAKKGTRENCSKREERGIGKFIFFGVGMLGYVSVCVWIWLGSLKLEERSQEPFCIVVAIMLCKWLVGALVWWYGMVSHCIAF